MNKLLQFFDTYVLKFGVIFTLIFTALYPKLPSIQVTHTWVYIRLEDFAISLVVFFWLIQLIRKKVKLALPTGIPIILYWITGGVSLVFCLLFIAPHLANFFPKIAVFEWVRRIEYMVLFFVAYSTVKSAKDIRDYSIALCATVAGVVLYGIGQHYYLTLWHIFPQFFEKYSFCFPSFQTGNEEFAKGIPLCLPADARTTSTFGGHYDLAAYLVLVLPIIFTFIVTVKKKVSKIFMSLLFLGSVAVLLFTASRTSFATYLVGITATILLLHKKKLLIPVWLVSIALLIIFSSSTAMRFLETIRFTSIVTNSQGQVVGVASSTLPSDLQKKIAKSSVIVSDAIPTQNLPTGSGFITLPQAPVATSVAIVKSKIDAREAEKLKLQYGGLELSTVSGSFLIQKALVYDISFTTRFQAEWPRDFAAFLKSPIFGTGYSSLTLASDNDYLRALGETGALGFIAFLSIFLVFGIFMKEVIKDTDDLSLRLFMYGLAGGVIGLFANAILIDVFESSKVAEALWILLGVGVGGLTLFEKRQIDYKKHIVNFLTSNFMLCVGLLLVTLLAFMSSINNFFVADDFTWLHWAASSTFHDVPRYFINSQDFFYRPVDKAIMLFLYTFFSFQPQGYHVFAIFIHFFVAVAVYFLFVELFKKKAWACVGSVLFILLPSHAEDVYWLATISSNIAPLFMLFGLLCYNKSQKTSRTIFYLGSLVLAGLGLASYEMGIVFPLLIIAFDAIMKQSYKKQWIFYIPFVVLDVLYVGIRTMSHTVAAGGDYAYSLVHLIPNFIGNFLGYILLFLFGEGSLPWYSILRASTKMYTLPLTGIVLVAGIICFILFKKKASLFKNQSVKLFVFGLAFAFITLLTFLGLGNITERYFYLASVGFIISALVIVRSLIAYGLQKSVKITYGIVVILSMVLVVWYGSSLQKEQNDWQHAGKITYDALGYFKIDQDSLPPGTTLYVVNRPIRYGSAWVFPVGLPDGLWFVYRDDKQVVNYAATVEEAKSLAGQKYPYIFTFDKKGQISQVQ